MLIDANHLALTLNDRPILRDVSLHLDKGCIYGLLGPNGAGKSSTINLLLGLYPSDNHDLKLFDGLCADPVALRRRVGVMPESGGFYEWMSAKAYLAWYAAFYGEVPATLDALLERVGLSAVGGQPIGQFSRGMKQRLALARALVHGPELLILDEPTNGLDPRGRREIHDLLIELAAQDAVGILLCTHLIDDVERLCTRIGIIDDGRTVLEGDLSVLLQASNKPRYRLRVTRIPKDRQLPPGVELLTEDSPWMTFEVHQSQANDIGQTWADLLLRGWSFDQIRVEKHTLEDRYLELTGGSEPQSQEQLA